MPTQREQELHQGDGPARLDQRDALLLGGGPQPAAGRDRLQLRLPERQRRVLLRDGPVQRGRPRLALRGRAAVGTGYRPASQSLVTAAAAATTAVTNSNAHAETSSRNRQIGDLKLNWTEAIASNCVATRYGQSIVIDGQGGHLGELQTRLSAVICCH